MYGQPSAGMIKKIFSFSARHASANENSGASRSRAGQGVRKDWRWRVGLGDEPTQVPLWLIHDDSLLNENHTPQGGWAPGGLPKVP